MGRNDGSPASPAPAGGRRLERLHLRAVLGQDSLSLLALWGLAIAQPLLDLFGKNPEFFVVNDLSRAEIVLFGLTLAVFAPAVLIGVQLLAAAVDPRVEGVVHQVLVAVLATAFGLTLLGQIGIEDSPILFLSGGFVGVVVAVFERTSPPLRTGLRYLALAPILFLVSFLGFSPTGQLLRGEAVSDVEPGRVARSTPLVVVSLDEFPVATLLRSDGTINGQRFPNFARLADGASWFPNATSVAPTTTESVPALLTGRLPEPGLLPTYRDHPRSLFTLLGDAYEHHGAEQVTDVCPSPYCEDDRAGIDIGRLRTALVDAAAVYAQASMPPSVRQHLPVVDRSWGGFITDVNSTGGTDSNAIFDAVTETSGAVTEEATLTDGADPDCPDIDLWCAPARISELIDDIGPSPKPALYFVHATTPHLPWIVDQEGRQYGVRSVNIPGVEIGGTWGSDPFFVRQGFQRHTLQVGNVDRLLGQLLDRLEEQGLWDDAMVVVTADHGVAFRPGEPLRTPTPTTLHEIYNIPLFIKFPGQREGDVRRGNALNIDVLPTIVDALDITTDWEFDGQSLVAGRPHRADKPVSHNGERTFVPAGFDGVLDVVRRDHEYLPNGESWFAVAAVGPYGDLIGVPVDGLDRTGDLGPGWRADQESTLADWDPAGDRLAPLLLVGRLDLDGATPPTDAIVVVNGLAAGAAGHFEAQDDGTARFSALLAGQALRAGANDVVLLVPTEPGGRTFVESPLLS